MRKTYWIFIFLFILLLHISSILTRWWFVEAITKILLIPFLISYFLSTTKNIGSPIKKWIVLALAFSWAGDILLLFVANDATFFLAGLCAFLIAHFFYILFFHGIRLAEVIKSKSLLLVPVLIYYVMLMGLLSPYLGDMKLPVRIYGVVICFMLLLAGHMLFIKNKRSGIMLLTGAVLFVLSDSVLAINKFYSPFPAAGVIIMLTYGIAQMLLTQGSVEYLNNKLKE